MPEAKKHLQNIIPYPVDEEFDWDLKLDFNENLIGPSPRVVRAIRNIKPEKIKFYPFYEKLIAAIAKYNKVKTENVIPVNGTDEGYRYIFDAYCGLGDNVLTVTPAFSMPKIYAAIANCNYKEVPYQTKWEFPIEEFLGEITPSVKLVIVTSPNSPTGELISDENLVRIIEKANNSLVVIDETYANYANKTYIEYSEKYDNVLILKSMSKDFATAGLRLGYLIGNREIIDNIRRIASPYSVNSVAAIAGVAALEDVRHVEWVKKEIAKSKKYLTEELAPIAQEVYPSETNFLCVDFGDRADYIYKKLLKNKIKTKILSGLAKNCFRLTIPPLRDAKKLMKVLKTKKPLLVFDMDGVLVDASASYRIAIQETYMFFSKKQVSLSEIQQWKNKGGYNNDWILTQKLLEEAKIKVKYEDIVKKFNEFYFGNDGDGLISNEKWLISKEDLQELSKKYDLAIFTGRQKKEAIFALKNAGVEDLFAPVITMDEVGEDQKPSPKGLEMIKAIVRPKKMYYLGDTRDDVKAGLAAEVPTIGVLPPQDKSEELKNLLKNDGAIGILDSVKNVEKFLEK
ncbi:MAG: aminotransferase class I/II-fold pyridoxal phosphate-dependent enzyme [bacterium]|nr:aminotransferase class I/II-fold pyridoxal phosphate-dependent enzyme [bacterium]